MISLHHESFPTIQQYQPPPESEPFSCTVPPHPPSTVPQLPTPSPLIQIHLAMYTHPTNKQFKQIY